LKPLGRDPDSPHRGNDFEIRYERTILNTKFSGSTREADAAHKVFKARVRAERIIRFVEADTAFHMAIARLSRNQLLIQAVSEARSQMERIMFAAIDINYYGETPGKEHHEILHAIQERDPERARREMHNHIMKSKDKVLGLTGASSYRR